MGDTDNGGRVQRRKAETIECWIDDGERVSEQQIREQKAFAAATGGMDYRA